MRKILIGTPSYSGTVDVWYVNALIHTRDMATAAGIELIPVFMSYDSLVQRARNDLLALALSEGFSDLFFIDSDMRWEPEWAMRIINHDVDVVGAAYRKKTDASELYTVKSDLPIPTDIKTGLGHTEAATSRKLSENSVRSGVD